MYNAKAALAAGLACLTFGVSAVVGGPLTGHAGWIRATTPSCASPLRAGPHRSVTSPAEVLCRPPAGLPLVKMLHAPLIRQTMPLDCESAALAVALQARGLNISQDWVFSHLPKDGRRAVMSDGRPLRWGDPNVAFVGNVDGSEMAFSGYGVYAAPIAAAAALAGATALARTGWTASQIEEEVRAGNPVVVWVNHDFLSLPVRTWLAWDGRAIPYTSDEHAVTVVGVNLKMHTVTMVDVAGGYLRTISTSAFSRAIAAFGGMAVAVS